LYSKKVCQTVACDAVAYQWQVAAPAVEQRDAMVEQMLLLQLLDDDNADHHCLKNVGRHQ
jgi:hypothetical protein